MEKKLLSDILRDSVVGGLCTSVEGDTQTPIEGIAYDSREVKPGYLYAALRGYTTDGHRYVGDAIRRGAAAILVEEDRLGPAPAVARLLAADSRAALSAISSAFYGHPTAQLPLVGITGTNGKTTISYLIKDMLEQGGGRVGLIGTPGVVVGGQRIAKGHNTTPESADIHRIAAGVLTSGCSHLVMEVTSHGLDQKRVDHCRFAVGIFSNLTYEHLDWHGSMECYFRSKARLFQLLPPGSTAVINMDDSYGKRLASLLHDGTRQLLTYSKAGRCDIWASGMQFDRLGHASFRLHTPNGVALATTRLFGTYNVENALAAVGGALALDIPLEKVIEALALSPGAPGRFERVDEGQGFTVVVDYAHTPDGYEKMLPEVARIRRRGSRLILVFGCAGSFRDSSKRPMMGSIAARFADMIVLTEEDSRTEDTARIMQEIRLGITEGDCKVEMIEDRAEAIDCALSAASTHDTVLILGKGDEMTQEVNHPSAWIGDRETARRLLRRRNS